MWIFIMISCIYPLKYWKKKGNKKTMYTIFYIFDDCCPSSLLLLSLVSNIGKSFLFCDLFLVLFFVMCAHFSTLVKWPVIMIQPISRRFFFPHGKRSVSKIKPQSQIKIKPKQRRQWPPISVVLGLFVLNHSNDNKQQKHHHRLHHSHRSS